MSPETALAVPALAVLALALLVDRVLGEFPNVLHPVVWIGAVAQGLLRFAPTAGWWRTFLFGVFLNLGVVATFAACAFGLLMVPWLPWTLLVGAFLLKASFAWRSLTDAADGVTGPLARGDLESARRGLRSLCSRDPRSLDADALLAGTIQSLAENTCDSIVAPLFYFAVGGVPAAIAYRAINTLDAMIGYRGEFEVIGKFSARLDDVVNWLPARLTALLFLLAGGALGHSLTAGCHIAWRDAGKTPSPNGGWPMATMAGLLGVRLEKPGVYTLGDPLCPLTPGTVRQANRVVNVTAMLTVALSAGVVCLYL